MNEEHEEWVQLREFPDYSISSIGRVRNDDTGRIMALSRNQLGITYVGLTKDHEQFKRSVTVLVAEAFLGPPHNFYFNTPIHLDGDRSNNRANNLMWRPRWFAIKYHHQFDNKKIQPALVPIVEVNTGERFENSFDACKKYGLLHKDLILSIVNGTIVIPTYQQFAFVAE